MKAVVRVLIAFLALLTAAAVTSPAASAARPVSGSVVGVSAVVPGAVVTVPPTRLADSRIGLQLRGPVAPHGTGTVRVMGCCGIPDIMGVTTVTVITTLTVVNPKRGGHITVWPSETNIPGTSNLNFTAGQTTSNTVLMSPGLEYGVDLFNGSGAPVHLVVDVTGYIAYSTGQPTTAAGAVIGVFPTRIADSRIGQQLRGPLGAMTTHDVQVSGRGGVPSGGVAAVIATVAAVNPAQAGYLTAWRGGTARPRTSNVNFQARHTIASTMVLPLSADGKIRVFNGSGGGLQVVVDVNAYIRAGTPTTAGMVATVTPARVADSRVGWQIPAAVPAAGTAAVKVAGIGGIPANGAAAVVATVTVVAPRAAGYATAWPSATPRPGTSNLNFAARQTVSTTVIVQIGPDGRIQVRNGSPGAAHLVVDVTGYTLAVPAGPGGAAWAWGEGYRGPLGNGGDTQSALPVAVAGPNNVIAMAGGLLTGYALHYDGTVWAWGAGTAGQLGNGATKDSSVPVRVSGLSGVTAIAGNFGTGYARRSDGTVWAWGAGTAGQLGNGATKNSSVPVRVSGLTNVSAIAAAGGTAYALRTDRTVRAWGTGTRGELGNGATANALVPVQVSGLTNITAVAAGCWADGGGAGYALRDNGTVSAWGWGLYGQLGNGATDTSLVPVQVSGLTNVTAIAASGATGYALRTDRTAQAWGRGAWGQLGNGSTGLSTVPVPVFGLANVTAIAAGSENGYAITH